MRDSRQTIRSAGLLAALLGAAAAGGSLGCSHSCEDTFTCPPELEAPSCPEDPAESAGDVPAECGVWASASLGSDTNDGSQDAPVATLGAAMVKALGGRRRVYACAETFAEPITWPAGVALHGGFYCTDLEWRYGAGAALTKVTAPADEIPLTLTGSTLPQPAILTDLKVIAENAAVPGGSSIAVLALSDARAEIRRADVIAGNGADGADGDGHLPAPAKDGVHGLDGAPACTAAVGNGGEMVALDCNDDASFGGQGGHGGELAANAGDDGEVAPAPNPQGFGIGGKGEDLAAGLFCTPGLGGAAGSDGDPGLGGFWPPRLTANGYVGVDGVGGKRGRAGQGGGGGGASAGSALCGALHGGAGGGSGGSGGCGGRGGKGGQAGGASIGLAVLTEALVLTDVKIGAGNGGNGGRGGMPQQGGQGGLPGIGGAGSLGAGGPKPGCVGGGGGYGGDGGHAGGGLGGPSLLVAYAGVPLPDSSGLAGLGQGKHGNGGPGSDTSLTSLHGHDGKTSLFEALLP